ncbi:hypothetical protein DL764_002901 [Monosporascus ibericus]|uniref:non-specific serine/threonine protein kinase n=1 Tax=Monosporascus ibericus TaxID=155417 RepID=A0A4Q4TND3_9PEZI|nr:hypothetical protein DL764_002901 [Monosporascus ibericus]
MAAVKILPKNSNQMPQAGSLAELDKWDRNRGEFASENHIPLAIEREVAILKLIDHPNIVKLYDIWENRQEIYLVLEYVELGDLFAIINAGGALSEEQAIYYFRQVLSAVEYCHSFNICHRDLKPENILINKHGQVKVADFGMACIQQSPSHQLRTSCGSPHYAAPELVGKQHYKGDKVDVWSLGVVLFAMLSCKLPFDHPQTSVLLTMAKKGAYRIPEYLSDEAKSLIKRMIEVDPERRISMKKIWKHPLIRKYDYVDDLNDNGGQPREIGRNGQCDQVQPEELDMQIVRQLKSMWHTYSEKYLAMKLTNPEPNDQKLFYWLLYKYREQRLENYGTDLPYSPSDFHHLRPGNWKKKYTTMEFPPLFGRTPSKFTVISTVTTDAGEQATETATEGGMTVQSYDPYKSSLNLGIDTAPSHAKITIHRNGSLARAPTRASYCASRLNGSTRSSSTYSRSFRGARNTGLGAPRRSLNSIRSGESIPYTRLAPRPKRGIDFPHVRKRSIDKHRGEGHRAPASIAGDDTTFDRDHMAPTSLAKRARLSRNSGRGGAGTLSMANLSQLRDETPTWMDELRHLGDSIAKDCDDAFNSTLLTCDSGIAEPTLDPSMLDFSLNSGMSPLAASTPNQTDQRPAESQHNSRPWDNRPLPKSPPHSDSVLHEIMMAKNEAAGRRDSTNDSPGHVDRVMTHLDRLVQPREPPLSTDPERRVTSAPIYSQYSTKWGKDTVALPSIYEGARQDALGDREKQRAVSVPGHWSEERKGLEFLAQRENTIRMVVSPSGPGYYDVPAPLRIRKKDPPGVAAHAQPQEELTLRQQYRRDEMKEPIAEEPATISRESSSATLKKKHSWLKRASRDKEATLNLRRDPIAGSAESLTMTETNSSSGHPLPPAKKKSFSFAFWRNEKEKPSFELSLAGPEFSDSPSPEPVRMFNYPARPPRNKKWNDQASSRNIEPRQNWLARLFRVKPATRYLCFLVSRRYARQEIVTALREWRKYGVRDVQMDKQRNIVFARVSKNNYLKLKEVSFAVEVMTVIEHGKRNQLSIVRLTQERGAASSFHKVVDTMKTLFRSRNILVEDKRKAKMMIKTLNS